jgi:hypothetical protein
MAFSLRGLKQDKFLPFSSCADNSLHHLDNIGMANFHRRIKRANNLSLSETLSGGPAGQLPKPPTYKGR